MPSILNATTSSGLVTSADNSGSLQLATNNGTTAVTIDTSQNVGIGTASPTARLDVRRSTTDGLIAEFHQSSGYGIDIASSDTVASISSGYLQAFTFKTDNGSGQVERMRLTSAGDLQFNSGYGSVATAYGCRAWVNFNGQGTVAIRASGNVSSITDNGAGDYYVNLTTSMPDTNYSVVATKQNITSNADASVADNIGGRLVNRVQIYTLEASVLADSSNINVAVFR
jgi:hypothetical protein